MGIPIIYYGDEQEFNGGNDPYNRESLWPYYNTQSEIYLMLKKFIAVRQENKIWELNQVQKYADDTFYSFSRGNVLLAAFTNSMDYQTRHLINLPFPDNSVLCSVNNQYDCIYPQNGSLDITLVGGEFKIYVVNSN